MRHSFKMACEEAKFRSAHLSGTVYVTAEANGKYAIGVGKQSRKKAVRSYNRSIPRVM